MIDEAKMRLQIKQTIGVKSSLNESLMKSFGKASVSLYNE